MKRLLPIFLFAICGLFSTACQPKLSPEQKKAELLQVFEWQNKMKNWILNEGIKNTYSYIDEMTPRQLEKYYGEEYNEYELNNLAWLYIYQYKPDLKKVLKKLPKPIKDPVREVGNVFLNDALDTKIALYQENVFKELGSTSLVAPKIYKEIFDPLLAELDNMEIQDGEIKEYVKKLRTLTMLHYVEINGFRFYSGGDIRNQGMVRKKWNIAEKEFAEAARPLYTNYCLPNCPFKAKDILAPFIAYGRYFSNEN